MTLKGHLKHIINSYNMTLQEKIAFIIVVYNTDLYKVLRKMQIRVLKGRLLIYYREGSIVIYETRIYKCYRTSL